MVLALPLPVLEVRPEAPATGSGPALYRRVAAPGARFDLTFTHSVFQVPVREMFRVDWRGRLILTEIRSTDPRVVGYYDIPGARAVEEPGNVRIVDLALAHDRLVLRGTPIGGRAFADSACSFALATLAGDWQTAVLGVELEHWALYLWKGGSTGCP